MENIKITRKWSWESVRRTCIQQNWYTCGDCKAYEKMLDKVDEIEPTTENLYLIAKDIKNHSKDQTISNVMYSLEKDAVNTFFDIEGEDF